MKPELLLDLAAQAMLLRPPAGVEPDYIRGFLARNRELLLELIGQSFPIRPTPAAPDPLARLDEEHALARRLLQAVVPLLTMPHFIDGPRYAELIEGIADHADWEERLLFPALRAAAPELAAALDHAAEEHSLIRTHLEELSAAIGQARRYRGPAIPLLLHHFDEEEAALRPWRGRLPALPEAPPGRLLQHADQLRRLPDPPPAAPDVVTPGGGARSAQPIPAEAWRLGMRVVNAEGEHGAIHWLHRWTLETRAGADTSALQVTDAQVRLDSGRVDVLRQAWPERRPPLRVLPDLRLADQTLLSPREAWHRLRRAEQRLAPLVERARAERKPEKRARRQQEEQEARQSYQELGAAFLAWVRQHPEGAPEGWDSREERRLVLELAPHRSPAEEWERAALRALPPDWQLRWRIGDAVLLHRFEGPLPEVDPGWRIAALQGAEAELQRGDERRRLPLWLLAADPSAPRPPAEWPEARRDRWFADLGRDLRADGDLASRSAAALAVQRHLADRGFALRSTLPPGPWTTAVRLTPPEGPLSEEQQSRLRALLPGLDIHPRELHFEPFRRAADEPSQPSGLHVPAADVPDLAAHLAAALQSEGVQLSRLGQSLLRRSPAAASPPARGPTPQQRLAAAVGCVDLDFELPRVGRIRVVCAQPGRRDVWHNIWVGAERYGYNGGRWARGLSPPPEILAELRRRGITAFERR